MLPEWQQALLKRQVGSAQAVVNTKIFSEWMIPIPSPVLQQAFATRLAILDTYRMRQRASLAGLEALQASLAHGFF
jgi:restriction endonuclease S subunit